MLAALETENELIQVLFESPVARDWPGVNEVMLQRGQMLFENQSRIRHVYFPRTSVISRMYLAKCGHTAEMGMVGREGLVGLCLLMGDDRANNDVIVHVPGMALRMEACAALRAYEQCRGFRQVVQRYTRVMITQISQIAVCNGLHPIESRLCRWLLMTLDRSWSEKVYLSHQFIAQMLAVRRESITHALLHLQQKGLIQNDRTCIVIRDRSGLEAASCECYDVIKDEYARLLK